MADLSPELTARIQSLEGLYAENAGRYYVALAGAWREAGEPARAEEILRENLKRYPGLSAHVLLGRCLADRGAVEEAANEFHYVLSIDAQNLIALRTLAEMAAAAGRQPEAARWYNELLSVDPMNAEARQALLHLARAGADAATADQPLPADARGGTGEGAPASGAASADEGEFGMIDLAPADLPASASAAPAGGAADGWGEISFDLAGEDEDAGGDQDAGAAPAADEEPAVPAGDFDAFGFGSVDLETEPSPASADASDEWPAFDAREDPGEAAAADVGLPAFSAAEDDGAADDGAGDDHAHAGAVDAEVVTETMAELCARQGLLPRAAEIYRELIRQRGQEPALLRRLDELEAQMGEAEEAARDDAAAPAAAEAPPEPAAAEDGGEEAPAWLESVDAFARGERESALPDAGPEAGLPAPEPERGGDEQAETEEPALAAAAPADAFADSFVNGFAGAEPARDTWEAPAVAVMDEDEALAHASAFAHDAEEAMSSASAEEAVDLSASWAVAAAPLDDHEDEEEPAAAGPEPVDLAAAGEAPLEGAAAEAESASVGETPSAAPAPSPTGRTMGGYFASLLAWAPAGSAAGSAIAAAAEPPAGAADADVADAGEAEPAAWEAPAPEAALAAEDESGRVTAEDEPWAASPAAAEPGAGEDPGAAAPSTVDVDTPVDEAPVLDDEPWSAAPSAEPVDIASFELDAASLGDADATAGAAVPDAGSGAEEPLPWELPAEPAAADAAPDAAPDAPFSFEDFFSPGEEGAAPAAPAVPEEAPPEPPRAPEPPPPAAEAPPASAPAAGTPAAGQEEDDEDLESFQAWLQSLKR